MTGKADVVIIGAGLAGLTAARHLQGEGLDVVVFEKADAPAAASVRTAAMGCSWTEGFNC